MKSAHLIDQILQLEAQKQNISNQAAFSVGQQIQPLDARIAELRAQLVRDNSSGPNAVEATAPVPTVAASKPKGRPKGSKNIPKPVPVEAEAS